MAENGAADKGDMIKGDLPATSLEMEEGLENKDQPEHGGRSLGPAEPDLILDERLTSAAAPFLYLISIILIAAVTYFLYRFLRG